MAEPLRPNQGNNGANGGFTPPSYLLYRSPSGPTPQPRPPAISGPTASPGLYTPGLGGYNPTYATAGTAGTPNGSYLTSPGTSSAAASPSSSSAASVYSTLLGQIASGT